MALVDQVIQMQKEGRTNSEILRNLQEQGLSAKQISDAINQAQIKNALSTNQMENQEQRSIMSEQTQPMASAMEQAPLPEGEQFIQQDQNNYYAQTPEAYAANYNTGEYGAGTVDPDTVTEIAQQVVEEEFKNYKKKTGDMASFKTNTEEKLSEIDDRLKRLETTIDKIQHAIIQKIGEFGENSAYIRKDLENLHDMTSKLMNPLIDNINALEKHTHKKSSKRNKK